MADAALRRGEGDADEERRQRDCRDREEAAREPDEDGGDQPPAREEEDREPRREQGGGDPAALRRRRPVDRVERVGSQIEREHREHRAEPGPASGRFATDHEQRAEQQGVERQDERPRDLHG